MLKIILATQFASQSYVQKANYQQWLQHQLKARDLCWDSYYSWGNLRGMSAQIYFSNFITLL